MDARRLGFAAGTFDVILCNNVLPFTRDDRAVLAEVRRCLKPSGVAMVDVDVQVAGRRRADAQAPRSRAIHAELRCEQRIAPLLRARLPPAIAAGRAEAARFDPLQGVSAAFRRRHGLKADAGVYLAFASPAAAAVFARRARAGVSVPS